MTTLQTATKKYFGAKVNIDHYAKFYLRRCIQNEQTVYSIMQLTNCSESLILSHVQDNVLSYEETLNFAAVYRHLPTPYQCIEIYLMGGFDNWYQKIKKA